jgi:thiosulfate dehydrogenase
MIRGVIVGFILGLAVIVGAAYFYFASGVAPVAVADSPMPFERKMANKALDAHIEKQHVGDSPVAADEPNFLAGAIIYNDNCAVCHGLPNHPVDLNTMMFPRPPQLFKGTGVTDDPASESYWKVENGIRLSGMPAFKNKLNDAQMWQVSLLVAHANEIPESVKEVLVPDIPARASATPPTVTSPRKSIQH